MIQFIKNLFSPNHKDRTRNHKPTFKDIYDDFGQIELDHNADKNYAYYLKELKNGATHYRIIEDNKKNCVYDLDDMEDYFCYLTIEIYYKNNRKMKRYSVMGDCTNARHIWYEIPNNISKEDVNHFIQQLQYCHTYLF